MSTIRQQLELTAPRAPVELGPSPRDIQRDALRDLVALATESTTTEAQIEQQFHSTTDVAGKELEKSKWSITQRFNGLLQSTKQKHETRRAELESQYKTKQEEAREGLNQARLKVDREHEPTERKARQQVDHAAWLAESVLEVAHNQIKEDAKKVREAIQANSEALDGIEQQAAKLLKKYHVPAPPPEPADGAETTGAEPEGRMHAQRDAANAHLARMRGLLLPNLLVGSAPWLALFLLCAIAGGMTFVLTGTSTPQWTSIGIAVGATAIVCVILRFAFRAMARSQVYQAMSPMRHAIVASRNAAKGYDEQEASKREGRDVEARKNRDAEVKRLKLKADPVLKTLAQKRAVATKAAEASYTQTVARLKSEYEAALNQTDESLKSELEAVNQRHAGELAATQQKFDSQTGGGRRLHDESRAQLERRLRDGLAHIKAPLGEKTGGSNGQSLHEWSDPYWSSWSPPKSFPQMVRFGDLTVDLKQIAGNAANIDGQSRLELPPSFTVPATLAFPRGASLLIQHERTGREQAIKVLQEVMTNLLTTLPPGRARFTIIDPVGRGQNFAGFMHLADHDEALVGTRIWTEPDQIEERLADMTEHMETVIQKYLRNEYPTIDDYNAQAGELAEPYRFLVIADFPNAFDSDSFQRLASIVATGARTGVYVLIARDIRVLLPSDSQFEDIQSHCVNLVQEEERFLWKDDVFGLFPLQLDSPPPEEVLTTILDKVGRGAKESKRVEVSFDTIAPRPQEFWTGDNSGELQVPIGRMGATKLQALRLGKGVAQHVLIAGKTGSGKSTLLHAMVTNLAMWYSPNQIELYLIDFKKGVEFKTYATHVLPHARVIAVESDREFGVSVLQRLDGELARRGEIFRKSGVQDLPSYRKTPDAIAMPRTLLIIDEFQEFFTEDDKLAQDAALLLDRLVRQGRAFGIHVLLGSQTIGGSSGLARSTLGQMGVRIALQTSEADSQLILGDNNSAARLLSRPGEAIYNDAGGLVEANSPFQVAYLNDDKREVYLSAVRKLADKSNGDGPPPPIVFEGNQPADVRENARLAMLLDSPQWPESQAVVAYGWMGDPVAIKDATAAIFRRQSGSNVLMVGQQEEQAMAVMLALITSLCTQYAPGGASFHVMDGTPADSALAGVFEKTRAVLPHDVKMVEYRLVPDAMTELAEEVKKRQEGDPAGMPEVYVFIYALQRYRMIRKADDEFSFSMGSDEEKKPQPGKQFADILRDGPALGIHMITWIDTVASLERTLDRSAIREFDNRVLFQMSANDSSTLIDSPAANKLGYFRALAYSEEQGVVEKFRPYALPDANWLKRVSEAMKNKSA